MKKRSGILLIILLVLLSTISLRSAACPEDYIATVEDKNGDDIYFADHTESAEEGNWIILEGGKAIRIPEPLSFTYKGVNQAEYANLSLKLEVDANTDYKLAYPFSTHSFYTLDENVTIDFKGSEGLANEIVKLYLVEMQSVGPSSLANAFKLIKGGSDESLKEIFEETVDSWELKGTVTLDEKGDFPSKVELEGLDSGLHGLFILLDNGCTKEKTVLSLSCFEVLEYELEITAEEIEKDENLDIGLELGENESGEFTYGALLIKESAYAADLKLTSDGTRAGTEVIINGIDIIEEFEINASNYESKLSKSELQTELLTLIGEGNGAISIGNQKNISLTTLGLPAEDYLLFAAVYEKGKGLVGIDQKELKINLEQEQKSPSTSKSDRLKIISKSSEDNVEGEVTLKDTPSSREEYEEETAYDSKGVATEIPKQGISKEIGFIIGFVAILLLGMVTLKKLK